MATRRVHLTFPEDLVQEPIIYTMAKRFDVVTNIRRANVEEAFGWVILELQGSDDAIGAALAYAEEAGVQVDTIAGDVLEG